MTADSSNGLFKWCDEKHRFVGIHETPEGLHRISSNGFCPWCGSRVDADEKGKSNPNGQISASLTQCRVCGWYKGAFVAYSYLAHTHYGCAIQEAILRKFDTNDEEHVSIAELGTYLKSAFADVYNVSWRRLEELVEDIFKQHGARTRLTKKTRDEGVDIIVLEGRGSTKSIVEVKRYAKHRKVGVRLVRELLGAQIIHQATKSYLVTTSMFSKDAHELVKQSVLKEHKLEVEFWDAIRLLKELDIYDEDVLPVRNIDPMIPIREQLPKGYAASKRVLKPISEIESLIEANESISHVEQ